MDNVNKISGKIDGVDITNRVVVIKKSAISIELSDRRFLATSGFGCKPYLRGSAVFGKWLIDGEEDRLARQDIEGLAAYENSTDKTGEDCTQQTLE